MASLQLYLPFSTGPSLPNFRFRSTPVGSSSERQALFNRIAPVYDNFNDLLSLGQHRIWKRMAVSWSGSKIGDSVLDLCCGSGDIAFLMSEKVEVNGKVIGLDFSKEQLSVASSRQKLKSKVCYMNIEWVEGDAHDLPFPNDQFDAITMGYGLRNVVDKHKAMEEIFRVLKAGSRVSILDFNKSTNQVTASFQELMINNVVVPVASGFGFGLEEDYKYLKRSIREFLTGEELEKLALDVGFSDAKFYEIGLIGGLMGNLVATRGVYKMKVACMVELKILIRFSCVSKRWCCLIICDPQFAKSHSQLASQQRALTQRRTFFPVLQSWEYNSNFDGGSIINLTYPSEEDLGEPAKVLTSCNGLVLVGDGIHACMSRLRKPATYQCKCKETLVKKQTHQGNNAVNNYLNSMKL